MPLFLPIVCSSELMVRQFPWAVHSTKVQARRLWGCELTQLYGLNALTLLAGEPRDTRKTNPQMLTSSCHAEENRGCVEGPRERLDKNGNVHAKI